MAYALRYYKELIHEDGSAHRLEIHKKDSTAEAVEIGAVIQGLSLEIQGSQGDVDSPIVKTSLSMTFVDASDIENGQKNGFWEEFYTPDALLWKVILMARNAQETAFRTIWGGYVTPDSFSEDLVYRGSVSIIARDNIGHMQDFPFDAEGDADGLISLRNLVESGWEKIQSPMVLDWRGETESNMWLICNGVSAPDTLMNVSQFEGMNWYKAIESALASYGIVMRWVGDNIVNVSSLRSMPLQGREVYDNLSYITPVFVAGAQRELVPAVKRVEESVDYDIEEISVPLVKTSEFSGEVVELGNAPYTAPAWVLNNTASGEGWSNPDPSKSLFFNPTAYEVEELPFLPAFEDTRNAVYNTMYFLVGPVGYAEYSRWVNPVDTTIRMRFGKPVFLVYDDTIGSALYNKLLYVDFQIKVTVDGTTYYLQDSGEWDTSAYDFHVSDETAGLTEVTHLIPLSLLGSSAILHIVFTCLYVEGGMLEETYIALHGLDFMVSENVPYLEKNAVNTVYNADNNVILSRSPEIGPAYNIVTLPGFVKNGIFYRSGDEILPARAWAWSGGSEQQMAVWNHLQLLCYYAKPNNLISGTIVNADLTSARAIYQWHGAEHLLVSGRYNFLRGQIESAVLREFARYEDMWSEVAGAAMPDTEEDSTTNVESGSSSGGSSSTYTNTTTVNIGSGGSGGGASYLNDLLDVNVDSVSAQSVLYYNGTEWVARSLAVLHEGYATDEELLTLSNLLASMWSIDADGNLVTDKQVIIKNNLIVTGDTASGGDGESSVVGISGVILNGVTYRDTDGDGLIDLGTIESGVAEITSAMVIEALGYTPYNASNPSGYITSSALNGYATQSWVEGKNYLTSHQTIHALTIKNSAGTTQLTYTPNSGAGSLTLTKAMVGLGSVENTALSTWAGSSKITTLGTITSGTWNGSKIANAYLANSAMTIAGNSVSLGGSLAVATLQTSLGLGSLAYKSSLVASDIPALDWSKITSGKPTTLAGYGITDGVLKHSGMYYYDLNTLLGATSAEIAPYFQRVGATSDVNNVGSARKGVIRLYGGGSESQLVFDHYTGTIYHRYYGASAFSDWRTIIHSGNYTDYTYSQSTIDTKLAGYLPLSGGTLTGGLTISSGNLIVAPTAGDAVFNKVYPTADNTYALGQDGRRWSNVRTVLINGGTPIHSGNIGSQSVNYATSAGSATKLATARTIWGQSFDGTGNVQGDFSLFPTTQGDNQSSGRLRFHTLAGRDTSPYIQGISVSGGYTRQRIGFFQTNALSYTPEYFEAMSILPNGNVGIGTTSPAYKLDVAGTGRFTSALMVGGALTASSTILASSVICGTGRLRVNASDNAANFGYMRVETVSSNIGLLHIGANYGGSVTITNAGVDVDAIGIYRGVVGIGRTYTYEELYANQAANTVLHVAGNQKIDGNLVVTGDIAA